jgi:hypothetical protein
MPGSCLYQGVNSARIGFQRGSYDFREASSNESRPSHKYLTLAHWTNPSKYSILQYPRYSPTFGYHTDGLEDGGIIQQEAA